LHGACLRRGFGRQACLPYRLRPHYPGQFALPRYRQPRLAVYPAHPRFGAHRPDLSQSSSIFNRPIFCIRTVFVGMLRRPRPAFALEQRCRPFQNLSPPRQHRMYTVLLPDLVDRLQPPDRFHPDLRLEFRAMQLALPDFAHALVLLGRQLKSVSDNRGPL